MSIPDWSNSIYGFFFVSAAIGLGAWRVFQHGVLTSIEKHLEEFTKYFSNSFMSLDEDGSARFTFFFDKKSFVLDNFYYPQILMDNSDFFKKNIRIQNISVF